MGSQHGKPLALAPRSGNARGAPVDAGAGLLPSRVVRARPDSIFAPAFPKAAPWVNVASLRMDQQAGQPVLVEFWDFCRVNSLRTLPYVKAWHERYADAGLRVVGIHTGGFAGSRDEDAIRAAVARLGIAYPVVIDSDLALWDLYGNQGWPARYLWDQRGCLVSMHYGEGAYAETETEIQGLLGAEREPLPPVRAEDDPDAVLVPQTDDHFGPYEGPFAAGEVWAVLDGRGRVTVNGTDVAVDGVGCYPLLRFPHHTSGMLSLEIGSGVACLQTCFTPGVDPERRVPGPPVGA